MRWFCAAVFFQAVYSALSTLAPFWEERHFLILAESRESAVERAEIIGREAEMAYATSGTDSVQWTFDSVNSVFEILEDSIVPGVEVYSRYLRASEVEGLKTPFDEL